MILFKTRLSVWLSAAFGILFFSQCQTDGLKSDLFSKRVIEPMFEKVIDTRQNLVFRFPKSIVKPEQIGQWDTTAFFYISPKVPGQYKWAAIDELVFSPDKAFAFATNYSATPTKALHNLFAEASGEEVIRFETPQLKIENIEGQWHKDKNDQVWLRFRLQMNQQILPDDLLAGLSLEADGKELVPELEQHFPTNIIYLKTNATGLNSNKNSLKLQASLNPEKCAASIKKWLKRKTEYTAKVAGINTLELYGLDINYAETGASVVLRLSQSIADSSSGKWIDIPGISGFSSHPNQAGLEVKGSFTSNATLELIAKKGLSGSAGGKLMADKTIGFHIGTSDPLVRFASSKALYLPKSGNRQVALKLEAVTEISVSVFQVFPNNILNVIQNQGTYYNEGSDYETDNGYYSDYQDESGTLILNRNYKVQTLTKEGNNYLLPLDFEGLPGQKGIYMVKVADVERRYIGAKKIISVTDIGLLAKTTQKEMWVKTQSLSENEALEKVKVTLIGNNNQPLFTAETNAEGEANIPLTKLAALGTQVKMIVAESQKDFSYMHFGQTRLETSRFPVDGIPFNQSGWQAEIFGPRNLYKPGEKINLQVLVRDQNLAAVADLPLTVKVISPMGKVVQMQKLTIGKFGNGKIDFSIPAYLATGSYHVEVIAPNKETLASHTLHIETFDPLPLEIQAATVPSILPFGKNWNVQLKVDNMFGLPASERPVQAQLTWEPADFQPENYADYIFNLNYAEQSADLLQADGFTDGQGSVKLNLPTSQIPSGQGLLKVKARIQVFDEAQVPVYKTLSSKMLTQNALLGFKLAGNQLFFRKLNKIELVSVNADGKVVNSNAFVELYLKTYTSVMESAPGEPNGYRYVNREDRKLVVQENIPLIGGKGRFNFVPKVAGNYELRIKTDASASRYLGGEYYVYEGENQAPPEEEANTEGNVEITCDQQSLKPGDLARIRFNCPFPGKLHVTFEQNRIINSQVIEAKGKTATLEIPVSSEMAPNVFISATLTRSIKGKKGENPLTVAYGYASVPVFLADKELKTSLKIAEKSLSGVKLPIDIVLSEGDETGIALAVVDEGILQITNYKIPDPFQFMHRKKALAVESYSMFGRIFAAVSGGKGKPGGDGLYMKANAESMDSKMLVSSFLVSEKPGKEPESGFSIVEKGKTKILRAMVDIPAGFSGKVRIMVVSFSKEKLGYAEKVVTIADPITIKTSLPDYMFPGDQFEGTASYFNTGNQVITFEPVIGQKGISVQTINWPANLTLKPGQVSRLGFKLSGNGDGKAKVSVSAKTGTKKYELSKDFSIKPPQWLVRQQYAGELEPGKFISLSRPDFMSGKNLRADLEMSQNPFTSLAPALKNLLHYPYGCLEQTVSAAFPLVYLPAEWIEKQGFVPNSESDQKWQKNAYMADAIQKISNLQQYNGGFSYWPGSGNTHDYYSVYATHFLLEAKQAGFAVEQSVISKAVEFVQELSKEKSMWEFSGSGQNGKRAFFYKLAPRIPYALFVASLAGKPNRQALLQWKAQPEKLDQEGRYMIACGLLAAGDAEGFNQLLPKTWNPTAQIVGPEKKANQYETESKDIEVSKTSTQEEAFVLCALASSWPNHPVAKMLAMRLKNKISLQSELMSTQESGMALVALSKLMAANSGKQTAFQADLGASSLMKGKSGRANLGQWNAPLLVKNNNTKGSLFYWINAQGTSSTGKIPEMDAGLELRKTYFNASGKAVDPTLLKINDLIVVRLSLKSKIGVPVSQIALVDVIPSSLRIENKRIGQNSDFKTPSPASEPDYMDIRRDRIHIFCEAGTTEKTFYYAVRVIGKGSYFWGPAEAQAMYQPALFSRFGGKNLLISDQLSKDLSKR